MTSLYCQSCGTPIDEHDNRAFIASWAVKCVNCYYGDNDPEWKAKQAADEREARKKLTDERLARLRRQGHQHPEFYESSSYNVSPRGHTQESFALAMWLQERRQIEAWQQENGLNVPVELLDECEYWRAIWMAKFYQEMRNVGSSASDGTHEALGALEPDHPSPGRADRLHSDTELVPATSRTGTDE